MLVLDSFRSGDNTALRHVAIVKPCSNCTALCIAERESYIQRTDEMMEQNRAHGIFQTRDELPVPEYTMDLAYFLEFIKGSGYRAGFGTYDVSSYSGRRLHLYGEMRIGGGKRDYISPSMKQFLDNRAMGIIEDNHSYIDHFDENELKKMLEMPGYLPKDTTGWSYLPPRGTKKNAA